MSQRICSIEGCDRKHVARGWCKRHWRRWQNHGDPLGGFSLAERMAAPDGLKHCGRCETVKPLEDFSPNPRGFRGRQSWCKACVNAWTMARYHKPEAAAYRKTEEYLRQRRLKEARIKYGPDAVPVAERRARGEGCDVCGKVTGRMAIDHCHETGRVRGLLCHPCNIALGNVQDDPTLLRALADYLERTGDATWTSLRQSTG